jgi:hypothetical protein
MSWSENRVPKFTSPEQVKTYLKEKRTSFEQINAVFHKLFQDDDFYDDLTLPVVKKAIAHWTGSNRLSPEEAATFQDHRRVVYVLQRFQMLQSVCYQAGTAIPMMNLLEKRYLDIDEFIEKEKTRISASVAAVPEASKQRTAVNKEKEKEKVAIKPEKKQSTAEVGQKVQPEKSRSSDGSVDKDTKQGNPEKEIKEEEEKAKQPATTIQEKLALVGNHESKEIRDFRSYTTLIIGSIFLILYFVLKSYFGI